MDAKKREKLEATNALAQRERSVLATMASDKRAASTREEPIHHREEKVARQERDQID